MSCAMNMTDCAAVSNYTLLSSAAVQISSYFIR